MKLKPLNMRLPNYPLLIKIILAFIIAAGLMVILSSCGTAHKLFTKHKVKLDSVVTKQIDSSHLVKKDSTHVTKTINSADVTTIIEFDMGDSAAIADTGADKTVNPPADYLPPKPTKKPVAHITISKEGDIDLHGAVAKITQFKNILHQAVDSMHILLNDSSNKQSNDNTAVHKDQTDTSKQVARKWNYSFLWWALLLLLIPIYKYREKISSFIQKLLS